MKIQRDGETQTSSQGLIGKAKMKTIRVTGVLVIAFVLCWTPYNAMFVW